MLFTTASLVFVKSACVNRRSVLSQLGSITVGAVALIVSQYQFPRLFPFLFAAAIAAYTVQIALYTRMFRHDFKACVEHLENYYDEDERGRMRWISRCFYSALAVGIVALCFCLTPYSHISYDLFTLSYTAYYVYIAGCVVNYRIKAGFIINARKELQAAQEQAEEEDEEPEQVIDWPEKMRAALEKRVEEKRYTEKDASPDKVAKELGTTKNLMNLYFSTHIGISFREWRTQLRVKEAERILRENNEVLIASLSDMVGVSDKSNFRKHFKLITGMTPKEYQEQINNK